jgi:hypothetical protein
MSNKIDILIIGKKMARGRAVDWSNLTRVVDVFADIERYQDNLLIKGDCWEWQGGQHSQGYGMVSVWDAATHKRKMVTTHRLAWRLEHNDKIGSKDFIIHSCRNNLCCNPAHLFKGDRDAIYQLKIDKKIRKPYSSARIPFTFPQLVYARYHSARKCRERFDITTEQSWHLRTLASSTGRGRCKWLDDYLHLYDTEGNLL